MNCNLENTAFAVILGKVVSYYDSSYYDRLPYLHVPDVRFRVVRELEAGGLYIALRIGLLVPCQGVLVLPIEVRFAHVSSGRWGGEGTCRLVRERERESVCVLVRVR